MNVASPDSIAIEEARNFRNVLGRFATGVTVITASLVTGERAGLTVNSFSSVSLNPPLVLWSLSSTSPSLGIFQRAEHFTINVLSATQADLAMKFARAQSDKFEGVPLAPGDDNAIRIEGALAHLICRNTFRYYGGDHVIFLGSVESYRGYDGRPLIFYQGQLSTL